MGFTLDTFLIRLTTNLFLNVISSLLVYCMIFLAGVYGRVIIFNLKRPIFFAFNKSIDLEYFIMSLVFQSEDNSLQETIVNELRDRKSGRLIDDKDKPANTKVLDLESNKYIFEARISKNSNVTPELDQETNDYSVTVSLRSKKLHYRDILTDVKDALVDYEGFIRGIVGNGIRNSFQVSIHGDNRTSALSGSIEGIQITIDKKSLNMGGKLTPLLNILKMSMISRNLTIYNMVKGKK